MRANIHPTYQQAEVVCSCGNIFYVGSTKTNMHVELCYKCHPVYTGQQRLVDTASKIDKWKMKMAAAQPKQTKKKEEVKEDTRPQTLAEMLRALKH